MTKPVTIELSGGGNIVITSHHMGAGYKTVKIERADIDDLIEELRAVLPTKVYTLVVHARVGVRPSVIPFSTLPKLKQRVCEIALRQPNLENRFKIAIELHMEHRDYDRGVEVVRVAQQNNTRILDFDVYWDDEPQVLL